MQPKHSAIVAGLTLALSFGTVAVPAPAAAEEPTPGVASDATDIDKGLYTQQSFSGVLRSVQGVSFVNVTTEMKYFTKYESHGNYNQGFSYGDGYNALGYYQFDRRWSLIPFMKQAYNYNPEKYSMLKDAIDRGSDISNANNAMYENGQLTELGRIAQEAFQSAYNTDPAEFSALQDAYAYNSYYAVTEAWLKSGLGIDISGRADCVKGMVWSLTNMCGTGGCREFFRWANLSNDMTDREFVTALSNSVVNNVASKYSSQPEYHEGWKNRYRNELKDCLVYITEDEAASTPSTPAESESASTPNSGGATDNGGDGDKMDTPPNDIDADNTPDSTPDNTVADTTNGGGSTSNGPASNDSPAGSSTSSDSTTSNSGGNTDSSTGSNDSSVDAGSNDESSSDTGSSSDAPSDSGVSKDDTNKGTDAPATSTVIKPSFAQQLGATLGSSFMAGVMTSTSSSQAPAQDAVVKKDESTNSSKADSADDSKSDDAKVDDSEKPESNKVVESNTDQSKPESDNKKDESEEKKSESDKKESGSEEKQGGSEEKQTESDNKQDESGKKDKKKSDEEKVKGGTEDHSDDQNKDQNKSETVTTTTTTTTTTKSSDGNMPKTGDLIVMASLASASLATLGATSIVSGKHKLDRQKKDSAEDDSEE